MKYYEQLEAIPIYQTGVMVIWILTGLIVFDEVKYYTNMQLLGILCSIVISCCGIKCLTMKTKMIAKQKKDEVDDQKADDLETTSNKWN